MNFIIKIVVATIAFMSSYAFALGYGYQVSCPQANGTTLVAIIPDRDAEVISGFISYIDDFGFASTARAAFSGTRPDTGEGAYRFTTTDDINTTYTFDVEATLDAVANWTYNDHRGQDACKAQRFYASGNTFSCQEVSTDGAQPWSLRVTFPSAPREATEATTTLLLRGLPVTVKTGPFELLFLEGGSGQYRYEFDLGESQSVAVNMDMVNLFGTALVTYGNERVHMRCHSLETDAQ